MLVLYATRGAVAPQLHSLSGDGTWCPSSASLRFGANEYPTDHYNYTRCFISGSIADHALIEVIGAESNVYTDRYARYSHGEVGAYHRGSIVSCDYISYDYSTARATDLIVIAIAPQSYVTRGEYNGAATIANVIAKRGSRSTLTQFNEDTTFAVIGSQSQPINVCCSGLQFYSVSPVDARRVMDSIYVNDRHAIWQMSRGSIWAQDVRVGDWMHTSNVNLWRTIDTRLLSIIMIGDLIHVVNRLDDKATFSTALFDTRNCDVYDTGNIQWRGSAREVVLPSLIYVDN